MIHGLPKSDDNGQCSLTVRRATQSDALAVAGLLTEAAEWLVAKRLWNDWAIPHPVEGVLARLKNATIFVASDLSDEIVATFELRLEDTRYWGTRPPDAGYLHRLAVRPNRMGKGIGRFLVDWAQNYLAQSGRSVLRLDCALENRTLCRYYERTGFSQVGCFNGSSTYKAALLERREA